MKQQSKKAYKFDSQYQEQVMLKDGTAVTLRQVIPADKSLLAQGMDDFSQESRYQRFLGAKAGLSDADLRYLTEVDGVDHFAIGALTCSEQGVGVARFVRFGQEGDVAEPAIAVVDSYQNKGLGRILFARLVAAARERGIRHFRGSMLSGNKPMNSLLHAVSNKICFEYKDSLVDFDMKLD